MDRHIVIIIWLSPMTIATDSNKILSHQAGARFAKEKLKMNLGKT